jgi:hypothetical protein
MAADEFVVEVDGLTKRFGERAADDSVLAGIAVYRIEPQRVPLERRFLEIASRLEEAA